MFALWKHARAICSSCVPPSIAQRIAAWETKSDSSSTELFYFIATRPDEAAGLHASPLTLPEMGELFSLLAPPLLLTLLPPWVDMPETSEHAVEGAAKVALLFTGHYLLLGFRVLNSWQNMRKSTEPNSWKIKFTGAKSQFTLKNCWNIWKELPLDAHHRGTKTYSNTEIKVAPFRDIDIRRPFTWFVLYVILFVLCKLKPHFKGPMSALIHDVPDNSHWFWSKRHCFVCFLIGLTDIITTYVIWFFFKDNDY